MPDWPNTIPEDLRRRLTATLSLRSVDAGDIWGDLRDWLRLHDVKPPDQPLPEYPAPGPKT